MYLTEIQKFYYGKTVFITGGTGLVGKCLVEVLLRLCFVKSIFVMVRPKKTKSYEERTQEYFNDVLFTKIKNNNPKDLHKVIFINGDISLNNLGLNSNDYNTIIENTNIVFHGAASVKLMAPLHELVPLNVIATKALLDVAKNMKNLQAMVYVSTAFTFCNLDKIDEVIHKPAFKAEFLIDLISNIRKENLEQIAPLLLDKFQNTYLLTKQAAEFVISEEHGHIPTVIYRPVAICPTYREPVPGWANNNSSGMGVSRAIAMGACKIMHFKTDARVHIVPVDMVANCIIAVAWNTAVNRQNELKVYNHFTEENGISRNKFMSAFVNSDFPLECAFRYPGYTMVTSAWLYHIYALFIHTIPNLILDVLSTFLGKHTSCYAKCNLSSKMLNMIKYFMEKDLNFETNNIPALWQQMKPEDQELFNFDSYSIDWDEYLYIFNRGIKEILLKEDMNELSKVKNKHKLLVSVITGSYKEIYRMSYPPS